METQRSKNDDNGNDENVVIRCAACGGNNRILRARTGDAPSCGRCKARLFPASPVLVTDATWKHEVEEYPIPVLVDFWAPWCGPCRAVAPMLERVAAARVGSVKIAKLNVDENPRLAARFQIQAIPTMMLFRGPELLTQIRGAVSQQALEAQLAQFL